MTVNEAVGVVNRFDPDTSSRARLQEAVRVLEGVTDNRPGASVIHARMLGRQLLDPATATTGSGVAPRPPSRTASWADPSRPEPTTEAPYGVAAMGTGDDVAAGGPQQALSPEFQSIVEGARNAGSGQDRVIGGLDYWNPQGNLGETLKSTAPTEPYYRGQEVVALNAMPAEERARLQETLLAAGLISGGSVIPGESDPATVAGMTRLMEMANSRGERWQNTLYRIQRSVDNGDISEQRDPFRYVANEYLPADPAALRNAIRDVAAQVVPDVEISDEEVEYLRGQFEQMGRQQFDAQEAQSLNDAKAQYEAGGMDGGGTVTSEAVQQVSAGDRFREFFEERYADNIERAEGADEEQGRREVTGANLGSLLQFATGGR